MTTDANSPSEDRRGRKVKYSTTASAPVYGFGLIGALVYFLQNADTFWAGVLGFFKALFWPGVLVYELLKYLEM